MFGIFKKKDHNFERAIQWYQLVEPRINMARRMRDSGQSSLGDIYNNNKTICLTTYRIQSNIDLQETIDDVNALLSFEFVRKYNFVIDPVANQILKSSKAVAKQLLNE